MKIPKMADSLKSSSSSAFVRKTKTQITMIDLVNEATTKTIEKLRAHFDIDHFNEAIDLLKKVRVKCTMFKYMRSSLLAYVLYMISDRKKHQSGPDSLPEQYLEDDTLKSTLSTHIDSKGLSDMVSLKQNIISYYDYIISLI